MFFLTASSARGILGPRAVLTAMLVLLTGFGHRASAAPITFRPAVTISGTSDVLTLGTLKFSYIYWGGNTAVNGVPFTSITSATGTGDFGLAFAGGSGSTAYFNGYYGAGPIMDALPSEYQQFLKGGVYRDGTSTGTVTMSNLTPNRMYAVQVWVNDNRDMSNLYTRQVRLSGGGGNSVDLDFNVQNVAGGVGQFAVGRFTANATSQTFNIQALSTSSGPSAQINAIQVRDISSFGGVWSGAASSAWDSSALNWGYGEAFSEIPAGAVFVFGDLNASGGAANPNVMIATSGINLNGGTLSFTNNGLNYVLDAAGTLGLSGSAGINKSGSGRLTILSPNSLSGATVISAGSVLAGAVGTIPSGSLTISAGASLDIGGFSQSVGVLTNNGTLTNTGSLATLNMTSMAGSATVLSGPLNLGFFGASTFAGSLGANIASLSNMSATTTLEATSATVQVGSLGKTLAGNAGLNVLGPVSGTGDLVVQANGSGLVFVDGNLNFNGTVTNNGIGTTGTHAGTGTSSTITLGTMIGRATKGTVFLSGEIGSGVTKVIQDSPTSALCLYADNTAWTGTLEIRRGSAIVTNYVGYTPNGAGKGTVIVGTGAADAAFLYHADFSPPPPSSEGSGGWLGAAGDQTFSNSLVIAGSGRNVVGDVFWSLTLTGTVTLSNADVIFANTNPQASGQTLTLSGGIVGNGNVFATNSTGSGSSKFVFNTKPVNHTGRITFNSGSVLGGFAGTNTNMTNEISGGVGPNVTEILASNNSPLTISSGSVNVGAQGLALSSQGSALMNVSSAIQGTGKLTVNIGSSGGVTLSGAVSNQGGFELNRTGSGAFNYTGAGTYSSITHSNNSSAWTFPSGNINIPAAGSTIRSTATSALSISSAISGTGLLSLDADSTGVMTLSGAITTSGSIINAGTGALTVGTFYTTAATGPSAVLLNSALGASVSRVIQDSIYSPLVINASNATLNAPFEIRQGALVVSNVAGTLTKQLGNGQVLLARAALMRRSSLQRGMQARRFRVVTVSRSRTQ